MSAPRASQLRLPHAQSATLQRPEQYERSEAIAWTRAYDAAAAYAAGHEGQVRAVEGAVSGVAGFRSEDGGPAAAAVFAAAWGAGWWCEWRYESYYDADGIDMVMNLRFSNELRRWRPSFRRLVRI